MTRDVPANLVEKPCRNRTRVERRPGRDGDRAAVARPPARSRRSEHARHRILARRDGADLSLQRRRAGRGLGPCPTGPRRSEAGASPPPRRRARGCQCTGSRSFRRPRLSMQCSIAAIGSGGGMGECSRSNASTERSSKRSLSSVSTLPPTTARSRAAPPLSDLIGLMSTGPGPKMSLRRCGRNRDARQEPGDRPRSQRRFNKATARSVGSGRG